MLHRRFAAAALSGAAVISLVAAAATSPVTLAQAPTPPMPMDQIHVKALYTEKCQACHEITGKYDPAVNGYSPQEWRRTVNRMARKTDSNISPTEAGYITDYLGALAPRNNRRGPVDPWATDATDVWAVTPTATRVFNFEPGGALTALTPTTAGVIGPAAVWHTVAGTTPDGTVMKVAPVKPSPSRFALLMDRQDQGRNLDVKIRFQIQSGAVSPAVGIVFGFTSTKTYDVLRFDSLHNTLSLLKIDEPTHTVLQTTPVVQPATPVPALASSVTTPSAKPAAPGWHTLRLLVSSGQIRGWIDREKRVSTQDSGYTGGKVGLWTQGDTVALFDDWTVDLYDTAQ